jgi:predicted signal transduction protein with EAL and GGDEF domain
MLIRAVGARLAASVPPDSVVARLGGDEFAFISVSRQPPDPTATLDRVFGAPFEIGGRTIEIGGSAGVATLEAGLGRDAVLRRADLALYRAKDMGRGVAVRFDEAIGAEAVRLDELETELRAAVEAGKIDVVFQPLVEAATNDMVGVEALARWTSPTRGAVGPDVFVAIAEKAGFVGALGMQVLDKALEEARAWPGLGVSVNVSPLQLRDPGFPGEVKETLDRRGFDPNLLTVEVTEGVLIANREQAARAFDALRAFGVRIALDDFGSGFASIGALREFKFDRMKIDRSLVWALERDDEASAVLDATIRLASAMRIAVTAEGVETETQARFVTASGCDNLQGYLFGKPVPASEVMARRFRFPLALSA